MSRISLHDNFLLSYTVDAHLREIELNTAFLDTEPNEFTNVRFKGVVAYHFVGDNLQTILFDISETTVEKIYDEGLELFQKNKNYSWPFQYESRNELLNRLRDSNIRAFAIESSYGLGGWVWAREITVEPNTGSPLVTREAVVRPKL